MNATDSELPALMISNGISSWVCALVIIMAITTAFQRADWVLKILLSIAATSLIVIGADMLIQGLHQRFIPQIWVACATLLKLSIAGVMLWLMLAYFRYGQLFQIDKIHLRARDLKTMARGIWSDESAMSIGAPPAAEAKPK